MPVLECADRARFGEMTLLSPAISQGAAAAPVARSLLRIATQEMRLALRLATLNAAWIRSELRPRRR